MDLQYIYDNSTTPPTQSQLQYKVDPDTVFVSTNEQQMYANLTITVFNPQQQAVTCQVFQFGFYVGGLYGDLTTQATGIESSSDQTSWSISQQASESPDQPTLYQFSAPATGTANLQLAPQQSLVFHLNGILINSAVGEGGTAIAITEVTGASFNTVNGEITVSKVEPTFSIEQFTANPPTPINPGDELTLLWQLTGSDHWQLYNTNTGTLLYDSETSSPPDADSYTDHPELNTTYKLIAWAGQLFTVGQANAMVNAPQFLPPLPYANPASVAPDGQTTLYWTTDHADTVTITAPNFAPPSVPATQGQFQVTVYEQTTYQLVASAANTSATDRQTVTVQINLPPPTITSFTATPQLSNPDGSVILAWETANADSADLKQSILGTSGQTDLGSVGVSQPSYQVTPTGISTYTLTVYGQEHTAQSSAVAAEQHSYSLGLNTTDLIYDGASLWGTTWDSQGNFVLKIQTSDGTVLGKYPTQAKPTPIFTPQALACIPNSGSVFALSENDCYVVKLQTSDGTMLATYAGSTYTGSNNWPSGTSIAVDANYIWVGYDLYTVDPNNPSGPLIYSGSYISQLIASNGLIQGTYQVATASQQAGTLQSIASDGTNVWIAASVFGLIKMQASNMQVLGTYLTQDNPRQVILDGTNVWVMCGNGSIQQLDDNGNVLKSFQVQIGYESLMVLAPGAICVAEQDDSAPTPAQTLQLLQQSDGSVIASFPVTFATLPYAFDGTCFWLLSGSGDAMVTLIKL